METYPGAVETQNEAEEAQKWNLGGQKRSREILKMEPRRLKNGAEEA
jgi:hypothetical protein